MQFVDDRWGTPTIVTTVNDNVYSDMDAEENGRNYGSPMMPLLLLILPLSTTLPIISTLLCCLSLITVLI